MSKNHWDSITLSKVSQYYDRILSKDVLSDPLWEEMKLLQKEEREIEKSFNDLHNQIRENREKRDNLMREIIFKWGIKKETN